MPRGDRTGPAGMGPMTGRAAGYCAGYAVPGYANPIPGRGAGFGGGGRGFGGGGRGWRNMYYATGLPGWMRFATSPTAPYAPQAYAPQMTAEQEIDYLKNQAEYFQKGLEEIKKRIDELETK
ncbi:DUF5320 domain-containing protein [candidate division KSB1 bacterium]|nr:DUF5320 domain-containing protein [candidate division KSB1 bacterium]